jgi:hypothetical protein
MDENEPLMKYRENEQSVKTHCIVVTGEEYSGYLFTGYTAGVIEEA